MKRLAILSACVAFALLPACAAEEGPGEETGATEEALEASWAEIDEDANPPSEADIDEASAQSDAEDDAKEPEEDDADEEIADAAAAAAPAIPPRFERPASCAAGTSLDLLVYYERNAHDLMERLKAHAKPCSQYFVAVPKVGGSAGKRDAALFARKVKGLGVHAFGPHFRATAEFHWGGAKKPGTNIRYPGWKNVEVVKLGPGKYETREIPRAKYFRVSWYLKGVLFRQRMAKAGYLPQSGDTWHVNELESMWTRSTVSQRAIRQMVPGLSDGDPDYDAFKDADPEIVAKTDAQKTEITKAARMSGVRGVLYISANGKRLPNETTNVNVERAVKQTLRHKRFWADMASYVSHWGQERYVTAEGSCLSGRSLAQQADSVAAELESFPLIASSAPRFKSGPHAGESTVGTAAFYLGRAYVPVINAAWRNPDIEPSVMRDFVGAQIHAARSFANDHRYSDGRIGIYFRPKVDERIKAGSAAAATQAADNARLADRTALSLNAAYDGAAGNAIAACGNAGVQGCRCDR
jgi:hypothetical protein